MGEGDTGHEDGVDKTAQKTALPAQVVPAKHFVRTGHEIDEVRNSRRST